MEVDKTNTRYYDKTVKTSKIFKVNDGYTRSVLAFGNQPNTDVFRKTYLPIKWG